LRMLNEGKGTSAGEMTQRIMHAACDFAGPGIPEDDMTMVIVRRLATR
jgi:serine phosphatase RsbU (regulator of sigma subunit)